MQSWCRCQLQGVSRPSSLLDTPPANCSLLHSAGCPHLCSSLSLQGRVPVIKLSFLPGDVIYLFLMPCDSRKGTELHAVYRSLGDKEGYITSFPCCSPTTLFQASSSQACETPSVRTTGSDAARGQGEGAAFGLGQGEQGEEKCVVCRNKGHWLEFQQGFRKKEIGVFTVNGCPLFHLPCFSKSFSCR